MSYAPVVILAGGRGSRLGEHTDTIPKPMVKVKGVPIIERIINHFVENGFSKFIISSGYKGEIISKYFSGVDYVKVINTGENTQTSGRILGIKEHLDNTNSFMVCYGDGLTDYDPYCLYELRKSSSAICTMLAVHPFGRFGELEFNSRGMVTRFSEKPISDKWINGGYFCFSKEIFDYLSMDGILETEVFGKLVNDKKLFCDSYEGFWRSVDTPKDLAELNEMDLP